MKRIVLVLALLVTSASAIYAQRALTEVNFTVNGIHSGSSIKKVEKLGKPIRVKNLGLNGCTDEYERTYYFPGLRVGTLGSKNGKIGLVYSIDVTTNHWTIAPGVRIGARKETILSKYGRPIYDEKGTLTFVTKDNLGFVSFEFRNGKLIRAGMMETVC